MIGICISGNDEYDNARNKYISFSDFVKNEPQFFKKRTRTILPNEIELWWSGDLI